MILSIHLKKKKSYDDGQADSKIAQSLGKGLP